MINVLKESLWKQFGASIDMLKNAITLWPEEFWNSDKRFFYVAYHCLIFLDYYLTIPPKKFSPQLPFTISESGAAVGESVDDLIPDKIYTKKELLDYIDTIRSKCHKLIAGLTEEKIKQRWIEEPDEIAASVTMQYSVLEILLYNMKHVQHHAAQLNMLLRNKINNAPEWIAEAGDEIK